MAEARLQWETALCHPPSISLLLSPSIPFPMPCTFMLLWMCPLHLPCVRHFPSSPTRLVWSKESLGNECPQNAIGLHFKLGESRCSSGVYRETKEVPVAVRPSHMVHCMVKEGLEKVSLEFMQPPECRPSSARASSSPIDVQVPLIDMADFCWEVGSKTVVQQIGGDAEEWASFSLLVTVQVINHGLSGALMQDAMQMCREFFALPMIEKAMCSMKTSSGIGYGRRFAVKERAKVDWVDRLGFWSATEVHRKR
uniref:Non-haem dioxygenase N-terminal domain-containing protein n=3 Tax=Physcomitrium patens TaxID=3218 RepID=A0A7I4DA57_PHYPA|nr:probable 2-oxoglutarate-dependent dioxygenase ANS isoform X1 [Physcomitrium patens]|eukprot:XP_024370205.1 probable 2-oxoglutarate-dependent dioxygenase ANS isoform X1 [Physcomitrella patens]